MGEVSQQKLQNWVCSNGNNGVMKKKLNSLCLDEQILLCKSCGSYRHIVVESLNS